MEEKRRRPPSQKVASSPLKVPLSTPLSRAYCTNHSVLHSREHVVRITLYSTLESTLYESCRVEVWAQNGRHGAQKVAGALLNPSLRQLNAIYDTFFSAPYLSSCRDWLKGFTNKFYSPQVRRRDRVPLESSTHAFIWLSPVLHSKYFSSIWISIKSRLIICSSQRLTPFVFLAGGGGCWKYSKWTEVWCFLCQ